MKYIKKFELLDEKIYPKVGYYVIMETSSVDNYLVNFIESNIGIISNVFKNKNTIVCVSYDNIPYNINSYFESNLRQFNINQIKYMSEDKSELEYIINANKYNL